MTFICDTVNTTEESHTIDLLSIQIDKYKMGKVSLFRAIQIYYHFKSNNQINPPKTIFSILNILFKDVLN